MKFLRSNNEGEFNSKEFNNILQSQGILHQTTIPHHPQQNGKAKRKNRTLMDVARSMLKTANLPNTFWEEAVATTCYLQNRLPTTTLSSQTPFKKWSGIKPDLSHLKIFGSTTYSYVPDATRNKLEDRATKQIFVSYGDRFGKKGYRLYNPITCKFQFSRSCIFYETSIISPSPQATSHEPSNQNSENLTHEEYDPSNDTVDLISHIANTNNKQLTPYSSTQEQSLSLQNSQEPTPWPISESSQTS